MRLIELPFVASAADVTALRARITSIPFDPNLPVTPSIVITPAGLPYLDQIATRFVELELTVTRKRPIAHFAQLSSILQVTWTDDVGLAKACAFEQLWRHLYPDDRAELWTLASHDDFSRFWIEKLGMRAEFGAEVLQVQTPTIGFRAKIHPFHSADPGRLAFESGVYSRL